MFRWTECRWYPSATMQWPHWSFSTYCDVLLVFRFVLELSVVKSVNVEWLGTQSRLSNYTELCSASHQDRNGGLMRTLVTETIHFLLVTFLYIQSTAMLRNDRLLTCKTHSSTHSFNHLWVTDVLSATVDSEVYRNEGLNFAGLEAHTEGPVQGYSSHFSKRGTRIKPYFWCRARTGSKKDRISERGQRLPENVKSERTWCTMSGAAEASPELQTMQAMREPFVQKSSAAWVERLCRRVFSSSRLLITWMGEKREQQAGG